MGGVFPELLGQRPVLEPLLARARRGELHHCYLFEGPPGVGKFTAAQMIACAGACEADPPARPCGACRTCRQFLGGTHPDCIRLHPDEKRATRTISVAQAREVIRVVGLRRYNARWRQVIVDPADKLMPQAANALLKTLEEPPEGTGFILVTSRVSAILQTVRSRSQRVRFRAVPEEELVQWLGARGVEEPGRVARRAQGQPGRALTLAGGGLKRLDAIRDDLLAAVTGGQGARDKYAEAMAKGGRAKATERQEALLEVLETLLRDAVLWAAGRRGRLANPDRPDVVERWARALWPGGVSRMLQEIDDARRRAGVNVNNRLLVEAMLTRLARELGEV